MKGWPFLRILQLLRQRDIQDLFSTEYSDLYRWKPGSFAAAFAQQDERRKEGTKLSISAKSIDAPREAVSAEHHSYRQILKSSALIGGSSMMKIGIGIVRTKAMALMLGPAGFGLIGLYGSIADLAQSIAGMGINSSGVRQIAEAVGSGETGRIARTVTVLRRTSILLGIAGAASAGPVLPAGVRPDVWQRRARSRRRGPVARRVLQPCVRRSERPHPGSAAHRRSRQHGRTGRPVQHAHQHPSDIHLPGKGSGAFACSHSGDDDPYLVVVQPESADSRFP